MPQNFFSRKNVFGIQRLVGSSLPRNPYDKGHTPLVLPMDRQPLKGALYSYNMGFMISPPANMSGVVLIELLQN